MAQLNPEIDHLLRRAGFGVSAEEVKTYRDMSPAQAVAHLVDYEGQPDDVDARIGRPDHAKVNASDAPRKAAFYTATAGPKDGAGKPLHLQDWKLKHLVDAAHEIGWITTPSQQVSDMLRDFRNLIHPYKQYREKLHITAGDASLLWTVSKHLLLELLRAK